jgi:hypothetical protein
MTDNSNGMLYGTGEAQSGSVRIFTDQGGIFRPKSPKAINVSGSLKDEAVSLITGASSALNFSKAVDRVKEKFQGSDLYGEMKGTSSADATQAYANLMKFSTINSQKMRYYVGDDGWVYDYDNKKILAYTDPSVDLYYRQIWADNAIGLELIGGTNLFNDTSFYVKPAPDSTLNWAPIPQWSGTEIIIDSSSCGNLIEDDLSLAEGSESPHTDASTPVGAQYFLAQHGSFRKTGDITIDYTYTNIGIPNNDMIMTNGWFRIGFWVKYDSSVASNYVFKDGEPVIRIRAVADDGVFRVPLNTDAELSDYDRDSFCTEDQPVALFVRRGRILEPGGSETVSTDMLSETLVGDVYLPVRWTWCQYVIHVDKNSQVRKIVMRMKSSHPSLAMRISGFTVERVEGPDTDRTGFTWFYDSSHAQKILRLPKADVKRLGDPDKWKRFFEWCATAPQPCEVRRSSIIDSSAGPYTRHTIHPDDNNLHLLNRDDFGRMIDEEPREFGNLFAHQDELDISVMPWGVNNYNQAYWGTGTKIVCSEFPYGSETGFGDYRLIVGFDGTDGEAWPADSCVQVLDIDPEDHPCGGTKILDVNPGDKVISVYSPRIPVDSSYGGYMILWYWVRSSNASAGYAFSGEDDGYGTLSNTWANLGKTEKFPNGWYIFAVWVKFSCDKKKPNNFRLKITKNGQNPELQLAGFGCMLTGDVNPVGAIGRRKLSQQHHPHDKAGATTHFPITSQDADDWLQMVKMPNIWCAPTINPDTGRTEFWFSIDRRLPGMIPWFNNEDGDGFPQDSGRYKLLARYRATPRWQVAGNYGYDGTNYSANNSAENGGLLALMGYNSTSGSYDFFPYWNAPWTTSAFGVLRGTTWATQASGTYAMTWWEHLVWSWLHAAWFGTVRPEKTDLRNTARSVKKYYNPSNRIWATQNYLAPTGQTDNNEAAYRHLTLDGSVLPWGSGIGSCPWYCQTHDLHDGSVDRYEAVPRSSVFMWMEDPVTARGVFTPGMYTFASFLRDKGPSPVLDYYKDPNTLNPVDYDLAGNGPLDGSTLIHRSTVWDEVRYTYSADAANFIKFIQSNADDNHYRPDHYRQRAKVINQIGGMSDANDVPVYRTSGTSYVSGIGYIDPLGLPVQMLPSRGLDSVRLYPKENWIRIAARSAMADMLVYSDCMTSADPADTSFAPMLFEDYIGSYGNPALYTKWIYPGNYSVSNLTTSYYPEALDGNAKTSLQQFWKCVEDSRCSHSMFSIMMAYSNINYGAGGHTVRLALDIAD